MVPKKFNFFRQLQETEKCCSQMTAGTPFCHSLGEYRLMMKPCLSGSLAAFALVAGCDQPGSAPPLSPDTQQARPSLVAKNNLKQRQADFLNRIRAADPQHRTIDHAILNEQNELGLILDRTVEMDRVPDLMRSILSQMAREFPAQDLTVLAYTPSNPPHKIGTARFSAQTRDMSYTPAQ
jgi:hypothetical protein